MSVISDGSAVYSAFRNIGKLFGNARKYSYFAVILKKLKEFAGSSIAGSLFMHTERREYTPESSVVYGKIKGIVSSAGNTADRTAAFIASKSSGSRIVRLGKSLVNSYINVAGRKKTYILIISSLSGFIAAYCLAYLATGRQKAFIWPFLLIPAIVCIVSAAVKGNLRAWSESSRICVLYHDIVDLRDNHDAIDKKADAEGNIQANPLSLAATAVSAAVIGLAAGTAAVFIPVPLMIMMFCAILAACLLINDYQRAIYILALYVILDYIFRQVISGGIISGYWDEMMFIAFVMLWFYKWFVYRRDRAARWTPLDIPLIFFFGIGIFLLIMKSPNIKIGIEGLRAVIEYMLWYFIAIRLFRNEAGVKKVLLILVFTGALLGFHGVFQYITKAPMPSNWIDSTESSLRTRAFSIIGSPNILGSFLVLLIPVCVSFLFTAKKVFNKLLFAGMASIMFICLIVTFSRSAWLGFAASVLFYLMYRERRKYLPVVIIAAILFLLLPPVTDRIAYLLSDEYITSSLRGGRLYRWPIGLKKLLSWPWFGVGLGRFGGAVAVNNRIPGAFYMDNYFLKTAVEMGFIGLAAFSALLYKLVSKGLHAIRRQVPGTESYILSQGIFAGICGVIIPNFFENVFEVPMMVTYFWLLAACLIFLGYIKGRSPEKESDLSAVQILR